MAKSGSGLDFHPAPLTNRLSSRGNSGSRALLLGGSGASGQLTLQERFDQLKKQQLSVKMKEKKRLQDKYFNNIRELKDAEGLTDRNENQGAGRESARASSKLSQGDQQVVQSSRQKFDDQLASLKHEFNRKINDLAQQSFVASPSQSRTMGTPSAQLQMSHVESARGTISGDISETQPCRLSPRRSLNK